MVVTIREDCISSRSLARRRDAVLEHGRIRMITVLAQFLKRSRRSITFLGEQGPVDAGEERILLNLINCWPFLRFSVEHS